MLNIFKVISVNFHILHTQDEGTCDHVLNFVALTYKCFRGKKPLKEREGREVCLIKNSKHKGNI